MHAACYIKNLLFFCFEELSMQTKPQLSLLFLSTFDLIFVVPSFFVFTSSEPLLLRREVSDIVFKVAFGSR